jgi:hypothetical protein
MILPPPCSCFGVLLVYRVEIARHLSKPVYIILSKFPPQLKDSTDEDLATILASAFLPEKRADMQTGSVRWPDNGPCYAADVMSLQAAEIRLVTFRAIIAGKRILSPKESRRWQIQSAGCITRCKNVLRARKALATLPSWDIQKRI